MKERRNLWLRKAKKLDELSIRTGIPRNVLMDLLVEHFGERLVEALEIARERVLSQELPKIKVTLD